MNKVENESKTEKTVKIEDIFETELDFRDEAFNLKTGLNDYE